MKKFKYLLTIILLFFIITPKVEAEICTKADILRVKGDANKVTFEYELNSEDETKSRFDIVIKGLTKDLYIEETTTGSTYVYNSNTDGVITISNIKGQQYIFKFYYLKCNSQLMRTYKLQLPTYNMHHNSPACKDIPSEVIEECGEWYQGEVDYEQLKEKVEKYKLSLQEQQKKEEKNKVFNTIKSFLLNNYIYIISGIIIMIIVTIIIAKNKKKGELE